MEVEEIHILVGEEALLYGPANIRACPEEAVPMEEDETRRIWRNIAVDSWKANSPRSAGVSNPLSANSLPESQPPPMPIERKMRAKRDDEDQEVHENEHEDAVPVLDRPWDPDV